MQPARQERRDGLLIPCATLGSAETGVVLGDQRGVTWMGPGSLEAVHLCSW